MRGSSERTRKLREESISLQPRMSMERALLETEFYKENAVKYETPILRALNFKNYCEKRFLYLGVNELIVGEKSIAPQVAPTYPELCCHTMEDIKILDERKNINFKVSKEDKKLHEDVIMPYWLGKSTRDKILKNMSQKWKDSYEAAVFTEFMEQRAPGHTVADDKFYKKGFIDFKREIQEEIENLSSLSDLNYYEKRNQLTAMMISCDAIMLLGDRYADLALELAEKENNEKRKNELKQIAENCKIVPRYKPETFTQAIQMYWFVHIGVTTELNTWDSFSPGRLDQYLYPFYEKDIRDGRINREEAIELLECLWIKFNNQPAPPKVGVTMKESATYTDFANLNTGGINPETGENGVNDVSYMILEVMDEMKLVQPSSNVQISEKTPDDFLKKAVEISRKGWGQPAFYNTEEIIEELINAGKEEKDAMYGGASGCVETGCHGREAYVLTGYLNVPKILEITLNDGVDIISGKTIGLKTGNPREFKTYEDLYAAFIKQLKYFVDIKISANHIIEKIFADNMPATFMSVLTTGCKEKGLDYNAGGSKYNTRYIQIVGIGTITDCLASIKKNIFDEEYFNMNDLLKALEDDYVGHDRIKHIISNRSPKYGNDDAYADKIMVEVFEDVLTYITGKPTACGGSYHIDMLPTTCHVYFGSVIGASPDGRLAYKPLTDGISPSKGADILGPTAVVKSCAKMNHAMTGGTLLNQKFTPNSIAGQDGINNVSALVRAYFKMGGHHIQFNVIDRSTLLKAQEKPDEYKNLIVRVAGYSDHFNNLDKALQDEIIDRTEQAF